jgi:mitogen-activated protein kinase organizer 1
LAAGDSYNTIRLWDLSTGRTLYRMVGHTGSVTTLAWDAEAEVLISGSFDTTVRVWPLESRAIAAGSQP